MQESKNRTERARAKESKRAGEMRYKKIGEQGQESKNRSAAAGYKSWRARKFDRGSRTS